ARRRGRAPARGAGPAVMGAGTPWRRKRRALAPLPAGCDAGRVPGSPGDSTMRRRRDILSIVVGLVLIAASLLEFLGVHLTGPHEPRPHWLVAAVGVVGLALCFPETVAGWWRRWREYKRGG